MAIIAVLSIVSTRLFIGNALERKIPDYNLRILNLLTDKNVKNFPVNELSAGNWDRVCIFGPYTNNVSDVLGFEWDIEQYTDVLRSDGHSVLLFVDDKEVIDLIVQNRGKGDFSSLYDQCFGYDTTLTINKARMSVSI